MWYFINITSFKHVKVQIALSTRVPSRPVDRPKAGDGDRGLSDLCFL